MAEKFDAVEVIRTKRDKQELSDEQIDWVIDAYTRGAVDPEQMSALGMAIFLNGMNRREIARWTQAMINSGERLGFQELGIPTSDKHSTGGVGDMITLPLAPLVAVFGVAVPQLSGRGLGHTGGTLDKLESIPGWDCNLTNEQIKQQLKDVGAVICAAGPNLAPADKKLYALRDVTSIVDCVPLIASSIMSKKIAEGTDALILDVKTGSGAFMKKREDAEELARTMVDLGKDAGVNTVALITNMESPLGNAAGNAIEVQQALDVLNGKGPADVVELTVALAGEMLAAAGKAAPPAEIEAALKDGRAMQKWREMISAQGGDPDAPLPTAQHSQDVPAEKSGRVTKLDALKVGVAAWRLGAGRARQGEPVQAGAGVIMHAKPGDLIEKGQPIFTLLTDTPERFDRALEALDGAVEISDPNAPYQPQPLIIERIA